MTVRAETAHAKINLYLHVVGRRADGYHLLDSLAVFAGAHDELEAVEADAPGISLVLDGPFGETLRGEDASDNLVMRAARALLGSGAPGLSMVLRKTLPVASGIGGGSADAAAALRLIRRLRPDADPGPGQLASIAAALGADVPVCLAQQPARMRGVGEVLVPAPALPPCFMVLVNCGVGVSTPAVFKARAPGFSADALLPAAWPDARAMAGDLSRLGNDLEAPAIAVCPPIAAALHLIGGTRGCLLARMSGSGATCFGLYETQALAEAAALALSRPGWWVWAGPMLPAASPG